jgi:hypothetical protein
VFEPKSTSAAASVSAAAGANADGEVLRLPLFFSLARVAYLSPLSLLQGHIIVSGPSCAVSSSAGSPPELAVDVELLLQRFLVDCVPALVTSAW